MDCNQMISSRNPAMVFSERGGAAGEFRTACDQEETPVLEHLAASLRPNKWTNEKHGLYLKSMEASFVHQLHDSIDILGWSSQKNPFDSSTQDHTVNHNSSGQFKVFREGHRGKINFTRDEVEIKKEDESSGVEEISSNPWIRRYMPECRQQTRTHDSGMAVEMRTRGMSMAIEFPESAFYVRHRPRASSNRGSSAHPAHPAHPAQSLEVTDQNFIDEDVKDDRECEIQSSKRIKTEPCAFP